MKNCKKKCESSSALKLALIITGSIVAAAGIILLIVKLCKKSGAKHVCDCCCDELDNSDSWDIDEDALGELELDDDCCDGDCTDCCGCDEAPVEETEAPAESNDAE